MLWHRKFMNKILTILAASISIISAPIMAQDLSARAHENENSIFDESRDAAADVNALLETIAQNGKMGIIIMGANWCHDSRALAGHFASARFAAMLAPKYEIVYVDVGVPQTGNGRNIDIAKHFGIKKIKGTPTVIIVDSNGDILNKKAAPKWRNAASRTEDDIFNRFANFGTNSR